MYHNDEPVLHRLECRLVPPSDLYPDCQCAIVLTERHLYVLEDDYKGGYDTHFAIPLGRIDNIGLYVSGEASGLASNRSAAGNVLRGFVYALSGAIVLSRNNGPLRNEVEFVRVDYRDETGKAQSVFFNKCAHNPRKLFKAYEKYRALRIPVEI